MFLKSPAPTIIIGAIGGASPILGMNWGGYGKMRKKNVLMLEYLGRYDRY
jgi:hypothetical protein